MLRVSELSVAYGSLRVLDRVSLEVGEGECVALLGGNASGKTSLLRAICGLTPASGEVEYCQAHISALPPHQRSLRGIAFCPAEQAMFPDMSVLENLQMGAYRFGKRGQAQGRQALQQVFALFPNLLQHARQRAGTLSGGEQKLVSLGRALLGQPRLLLLDEPTLGLSTEGMAVWVSAMQTLIRQGLTVFFSEQNVALATHLAGRAYVLERGRLEDLDEDDTHEADRLPGHQTPST